MLITVRAPLKGDRAPLKGLGNPVGLVSVSTYNWAYNPKYNWLTHIRPVRETISRATSPAVSGY